MAGGEHPAELKAMLGAVRKAHPEDVRFGINSRLGDDYEGITLGGGVDDEQNSRDIDSVANFEGAHSRDLCTEGLIFRVVAGSAADPKCRVGYVVATSRADADAFATVPTGVAWRFHGAYNQAPNDERRLAARAFAGAIVERCLAEDGDSLDPYDPLQTPDAIRESLATLQVAQSGEIVFAIQEK